MIFTHDRTLRTSNLLLVWKKKNKLHEQACISRSARGAVWGVLTCLFVLSRYKGPKIFFACGAPRIPLEISKETVFSLQCFSFGPGAVLGGAYMLVRQHACSCRRVSVRTRTLPALASTSFVSKSGRNQN